MNAAAAALLVLSILAGAAVLIARHRKHPGPAPLVLILRQPLGKESGVAIVRWRDEELVIGYGTAGVVRLAGASALEEHR